MQSASATPEVVSAKPEVVSETPEVVPAVFGALWQQVLMSFAGPEMSKSSYSHMYIHICTYLHM
jgi:hypothetical protein